MLNFTVDPKTCTHCGLCAKVCVAHVITLDSGNPTIPAAVADECVKCQQCFAVCPTGALSIFGLKPSDSRKIAGNLPTTEQLETLIKGRRSLRCFQNENVAPDVLRRLLDVAWHAPTGVNQQDVVFTTIDDRDVMAKLRTSVYADLARVVRDGKLPPGLEFFADMSRAWAEKKVDGIFRSAPHLLLASVPNDSRCLVQNGMIALATFDLFAQTLDVGTLWCGLAQLALVHLLPGYTTKLGVPSDHQVVYTMVFGKPAVRYARTVQRTPAKIHRVSNWGQ